MKHGSSAVVHTLLCIVLIAAEINAFDWLEKFLIVSPTNEKLVFSFIAETLGSQKKTFFSSWLPMKTFMSLLTKIF